MRISLATVVFIFFFSVLKAQDPHFSQYYTTAVFVNPALTGVFNGSFRMAINHRQQWASILGSRPYITSSGSFDYRRRVGRGDYWAVGLNLYNDQVGTGRLARNQAQASFSYLKQLNGSRYRNKDMYLVAGAQVGAGQQSISYNNLWFSRQWDPNGENIDPNLPSFENPNERTDIYPDFAAGLVWYVLFDDDASLYIGGAMHHINQPKASFFGNANETIFSKISGNIGGQVPLNREFSLLPAMLFMQQGPSMQINTGTNLRYTNRDWKDMALRVGTFTRVANKYKSGVLVDAVIFSTMVELQRWNFGFSYDINTSILRQASSRRGAFEFSMVYTHPEKARYRTRCPRF